MLHDSSLFLFSAVGTAPISFQAVSPSNTVALVIGVIGLVLIAWFSRRKDSRVWLAPLVLCAFLGVVEAEKYLNSAQRFDQIGVLSTGVQIDSKRDSKLGRFIPFNKISSIKNGRSGRFGDACRLKIALTSGDFIYSVNFFDHRGSCVGIDASGIAISSVAKRPV
jgi:hypothetical protein